MDAMHYHLYASASVGSDSSPAGSADRSMAWSWVDENGESAPPERWSAPAEVPELPLALEISPEVKIRL